MDYVLLQHYWWFIISLLGALLVFLLFVQGGQTLLYTIGKNDIEKTMIINSLGRKWEFTYTTLVVFGGAFFASFPLFYSTSFGGAYWVWMAILICFVIQAVAYEFRMKKGNLLGQRGYEIFLLINGFGGLLLLGTAVGTFFTGSEFLVDKNNITNIGMPIISRWMNPALGLEAVLNPRNLLLGISVFFLARSIASLYFMNNIDDATIFGRAKKQVLINTILFLVFFLPFLVWTLLANGFAVNPLTHEVYMEPYKYALNYIQVPVLGILLLCGVVLYLFGTAKSAFSKHYTKGIWFSGIGATLVVLSLFLNLGYNNTCFYPSTYNLQSSLTIFNSSSSKVTLEVMSYVSLLVPFVLAYIFYTWRVMDKQPITEKEMETPTEHKY